MVADTRLEQLQRWLSDELALPPYRIAPASSDASFRRYFRITFGGTSRIVMDAPPEREDIRPFITISALLEQLGLHVPAVFAQNPGAGFLLLSDLGTRRYLDELSDGSAARLYGDAIDALIRMQSCPAARLRQLPQYEAALLRAEMELFRDWYLLRLKGFSLSDAQAARFEEAVGFLIESALEQPQVLVHRDYHSRNLMVTDPNPGILDFQDAVAGPVTYDLVSLLRDCYICWPQQQVEQWVWRYHRQAVRAGILSGVERRQLLRWFDLMGVQRHLKASGIFARLRLRDGKPGYLRDIPRTLRYVGQVCARYPELHGLLGELAP